MSSIKFSYTKTPVNITSNNDIKADEINENNKTVNSFYQNLQETLDNGNREVFGEASEEFEFHCVNNTKIKTSYNTSGNISISCNIPASDNISPNYINLLIYNKELMPSDPTKEARTEDEAIMRILTQWIKSDDMLTYYYFNSSLKPFNNVPPVDMYKILHQKQEDSDTVFKWWNYGRVNWADGNLSRDLCIAYAAKLNHLFHYIISNDLTVADDKLRELITDLFTNGKDTIKLKDSTNSNETITTYKFYPWSSGALILPSLVNLIANYTNPQLHALSYCGYIGKNSMLYTSPGVRSIDELAKNDNTKFRSEAALKDYNDDNYKYIRHNSVATFDINEGMGINIGETNYPFRPYNPEYPDFTAPHVMANNMINIPSDKLLTDDVFRDNETADWRFPGKNTKTFKGIGSTNGERTTEMFEYHTEELDQQVLGEVLIEKNESGEVIKGPKVRDVKTLEKILIRETRTRDIKIPIRYYLSQKTVRAPTHYLEPDYAQGDSKSDIPSKNRHGKGWDAKDDFCYSWFIVCTDSWYWAYSKAQLDQYRNFQSYYVNRDIQADQNNFINNVVPQLIYESEKLSGGLANNDDPDLIVPFNDIKFVDYPKSINNYKANNNQFTNCSPGKYAIDILHSNVCYLTNGSSWTTKKKGKKDRYYFTTPALKAGHYTQNVKDINSYNIFGVGNNVITVNSDSEKNNWASFTNYYNGGFDNTLKYYTTIRITYTIEYHKPLKAWTELTGNYNVEKPLSVYVPTDNYNNPTTRKTIIYKFNPLISMSKMNKNLYVFTNQTFNFWMAMIRSKQGCQMILNAIRRYAKEHIDMALLCKTSMIMRPYVNKFFGPSSTVKDLCFINFPFGPPLVYIPTTTILTDKFYKPETVVYEDPKYNKYNKSASNVNIIRSLSTGDKSKDSNNYLDLVFSEMIDMARIQNIPLSNDSYFAIMLPEKGQNILDVISNSISGAVNQANMIIVSNWNDPNGPGFSKEIPKIIMSFRPLTQDTAGSHLSGLRSAYKYITEVSVPIITFHKEVGSSYIELRIDTRSQTADYTDNNEGDKDPQDTPENLQQEIANKEVQDSQCDPDSGNASQCRNITASDTNSSASPSTANPNTPTNANTSPNTTPENTEEHFRVMRWFRGEKVKEALDGSQPVNDGNANAPSVENKSNDIIIKTESSGYAGKGSFPSKNILYIYVSNNGIQDFTSSLQVSKDENGKVSGVANNMLRVNYRGLDSMYPCDCLRLRNVDLYGSLIE